MASEIRLPANHAGKDVPPLEASPECNSTSCVFTQKLISLPGARELALADVERCARHFDAVVADVLRVDHIARADEARDEPRLRPVVTSSGVPICSMRPAFMTTMRSAIVMASTWSWVT